MQVDDESVSPGFWVHKHHYHKQSILVGHRDWSVLKRSNRETFYMVKVWCQHVFHHDTGRSAGRRGIISARNVTTLASHNGHLRGLGVSWYSLETTCHCIGELLNLRHYWWSFHTTLLVELIDAPELDRSYYRNQQGAHLTAMTGWCWFPRPLKIPCSD